MTSFRIRSALANTELVATHRQYEIFMGVLRENLGGEFNLLPVEDRLDNDLQTELLTDMTDIDLDSTEPPAEQAETKDEVYLSSIGIPATKPEDSETTRSDSPSNEDFRWISLDLEFTLENVSLHLHLDDSLTQASTPLARLNFRNSNVIFHGFTFGTLEDAGFSIHIVSEEILAQDTRPDVPSSPSSQFRDILAPSREHGSAGMTTPQLEIRYHSNPKLAKLDVLLHRARLIIAPRWILSLKEYLASPNSIDFAAPTTDLSDAQSPAPSTPRSRSPHHSSTDSDHELTRNETSLSAKRPTVTKPARKITIKFCVHHAEFVAVEDLLSKFSQGVVVNFNADYKFNSAAGYVDFEHDTGRDRQLLGSSSNVASSELQEVLIHVSFSSHFYHFD
jgi:hypothetical protein